MISEEFFLVADPDIVTFSNVEPNKTYGTILKLLNVYEQPLEITIEPSNTRRYEVSPESMEILPGETCAVRIQLRGDQEIAEIGHLEDYLYIRCEEFDRRVKIDVKARQQPRSGHKTYPSQSMDNKFLQGSISESSQNQSGLVADENIELRRVIEALNEKITEDAQKIEEYELMIKEYQDFSKTSGQGWEQEIEKQREINRNLEIQVEQGKMLEAYAEDLKSMLVQKSPDLKEALDTALKQERLANERKNQRILDVFHQKDQQISELEAKVGDLEDKNQQLRDLLEDHRTIMRNSEDTLRSEKIDQKELQAQLKSAINKITLMEEEIAHVRARSREFEEELKTKNLEFNKTREVNADLERVNRDLKDQIRTMKNAIDDMTSRENRLKAFGEELEYSRKDAERRLAEKEQYLSELQKKVIDQANTIEHLASKVDSSDFLMKINDLEKEKREIEFKHHILRSENEKLKKSMSDSHFLEQMGEGEGQSPYQRMTSPSKMALESGQRKKISDLENQISDLNRSIQRMQEGMLYEQRNKHDVIEGQTVKISELLAKIEELQSIRKNASKESESQSEQSSARIEELTQKLHITEDMLNRERMEYHNIIKEYEELERRFEECESERRRAVEQIDILTARIGHDSPSGKFQESEMISKLNSRLNLIKIREQNLQEENDRLRQIIEEMQEEGKDVTPTPPFSKGKLNFEGTQIPSALKQSPMRRSVKDADYQVENFRRENEILKLAKDTLEKEMIDTISKNRTLSAENNSLQQKLSLISREKTELNTIVREMEDIMNEKEKQALEENLYLKKRTLEQESEMLEYKKKLDDLDRAYDEARSMHDKLKLSEKMRENLEREIIELNSRIEELQDYGMQHHELKTDMAVRERDVAINELRTANKMLQTRVQDKDRNMNDLSLKNEELIREVQKLESVIQDLRLEKEHEVKRREYNDRELREKINHLQERANQQLAEYARSKSDLQGEYENLSKMQQDTVDMLRRENKEMEDKIFKGLQEREQQLHKELDLQRQIDHLNNEIQLLQSQPPQVQQVFVAPKPSRKRSASSMSLQQPSSDTEEASRKPRKSTKPSTREKSLVKKYENELEFKELELTEMRHKLEVLQLRVVNLEGEMTSVLEQRERLTRDKYKLEEQLQNRSPAGKSRVPEDFDQRVSNELQELRKCMSIMKKERDRLAIHMQLKEEDSIDQHRQVQDFIHLIRTIEAKNKALEQEHALVVTNLNRRLEALASENENLTKEMRDLLMRSNEKNDVEKRMEMERRDLVTKLNFEVELRKTLEERLREIETNISVEKEDADNEISKYKHESDMVRRILYEVKNEMAEQQKSQQTTIDLYEANIKFLKQRFSDDIHELQNRITALATSKENNGPRGVSPKGRKGQIIENYFENAINLAHKDSKIKALNDKVKSSQDEAKTLRIENKKLSEQIESLKENISKRTYKSSKSSAKILEEKESIRELSSIAPPPIVDTANESKKILLEAQVMSLRGEIKKHTLENAQLVQKNNEFAEELQILEDENRKLVQDNDKLSHELKDNNKLYKQEMNKLLAELEGLRTKFTDDSREKKLAKDLAECESHLKSCKEDLLRKNEIIMSLKASKDSNQDEYLRIKKENDEMREEFEKAKKAKQELSRKDQYVKEFKDKIESLRASEKALQEEKAQLQEKVKALRSDAQRKETALKELREKYDDLLSHRDESKVSREDTEKSQEMLKKLKLEIDRKEQTIRGLLNKLETTENKLESMKTEMTMKSQNETKDFASETRALENAKIALKKTDSRCQMLVFLLKKLFREVMTSLQKSRARTVKDSSMSRSQFDARSYSESLDILGMSPDQLQGFFDPVHTPSGRELEDTPHLKKLADRFEVELNQTENLNVNNLCEMLLNLIDQRVDLERRAS